MDSRSTGTMTQGAAGGIQMQEGDTFSCPNCGCEIRLQRHGDPARMQQMDTFTCCCGVRMQKHASRSA